MKNQLLILLTCFALTHSFAQHIEFNSSDPQPILEDVYGGDFASGDIDGDGDQDLMILGIPGRVKLYFNDGSGDFTEAVNAPFPRTSDGDIIFKDLDGDMDLDLFFSGRSGVLPDFTFIGDFSHVYLNDGLGNFTQLMNEGILDTEEGRVVIGDLDGDNDEDIILSGTNVYLNNGDATFTLSTSAVPTPELDFTITDLFDMDNDGDLDLVLSGTETDNTGFMALYTNDSSANFQLNSGSSFIQFKANDIDTGDLDGDGDMEILVSGLNEDNTPDTRVYNNNGDGSFSQSFNYGLTDLFSGTNSIADLDNDGDLDIILIGSQNGGLPNIYGFVYENNGGWVSPVALLGGEYIANNLVDDFNGDGLNDIIVQGFVDDTNIYFNTTNSNSSSSCPGDFNLDGIISAFDLSAFLSAFGSSCTP